MQRIILQLIFCFITLSSFPDRYITRGPNSGEIYFLGPTYSGEGLYYSTDYGMTAICVDSTIYQAMTITADKTPGVVYYVTMQEGLYISDDYGNQGTWQYRNYGIKLQINSGLIEGQIYSSFSKHSNDYGYNFMNHSYNGFFGNKRDVEIDNQENVGYVIVDNSSINDSLFLLISYDNFENLTIHNVLPMWSSNVVRLSRGSFDGETYLFNRNEAKLYYSNDYCLNFTEVNYFNESYDFHDIVGGRIQGEVYVFFRDINSLWLNANIYVFYSNDYGSTFEVFHPFSKGIEPLLANFSTIDKEVQLTTPVEFLNYSIGAIIEYQWDFENDGIIDSYDEFPTHIYQDTGYYSVKLSVVGQDSTNTFIKENYIHVIDTITNNPNLKYQNINIYPNPFNDKISIELRPDYKMIEIYDLNGKSHFSKALFQENKTEIIELRNLEKGIYILKIKTEGQVITKKIIKI